jgi:ribosomal protein S18 acetylase RimI-like enzyme
LSTAPRGKIEGMMAPTDSWAIRLGEQGDLPPVLGLWRAAESPPTATDDEASLSRLLGHDPGCLLVAEAGGEIVGSLIAAWDGWRGSFYRLAVDPAWRRRGLATELVHAGEERLRGLGAARLTAIVASGEGAAAELWCAAGYERQGDRRRFVRMLAG